MSSLNQSDFVKLIRGKVFALQSDGAHPLIPKVFATTYFIRELRISPHAPPERIRAMKDDAEGESLGVQDDMANSLVAGEEHRTTSYAMEKNVKPFRLNGLHDSFEPVPISVAVDPVALITTECITVTSAMRKHARWAHSSVSAILGGGSNTSSPVMQGSRPSTPREELAQRKGHKNRPSWTEGNQDESLANRWGLRGKKGKSMQDNPLMAGFGRLRRELVGCKGIIL